MAKNGVTPISPKQGDTVRAGHAVTFKMRVVGQHHGVFVHVCKSRRTKPNGMICRTEALGPAKKVQGSRYAYTQKLFDFPEYWLNRPGTYYWQAYRAHCNTAITDCKAEGPIVKFKVA